MLLGIVLINYNSFTQADIHNLATNILTALFAKIDQAGQVPEKVAENEYLMKCMCGCAELIPRLIAVTGVMRVIITARQSLISVYEPILTKLISIIGIMSKNPSNPNFAQFTFESISALIRYASLFDTRRATNITPLGLL